MLLRSTLGVLVMMSLTAAGCGDKGGGDEGAGTAAGTQGSGGTSETGAESNGSNSGASQGSQGDSDSSASGDTDSGRGSSSGPGGDSETASSAGSSTDSGTTGATGNSTDTGTATDTGGTMTTGSVECVTDVHEPNDDLMNATDLGEITDADGSGTALTGVLAGAGDVDWFLYRGTDEVGTTVDPYRELTTGDTITMCKFARCDAGADATTVTCPEGSTDATAPSGDAGCCVTGTGTVALHLAASANPLGNNGLECDGGDDNAIIAISLTTDADACVDYNLAYHF